MVPPDHIQTPQTGSESSVFHQQVTLQQTSAWVDLKFSTLIKILVEKQEATRLFIEEQKEAAVSEAKGRLSQLEEQREKLRECRSQITDVHNLSDTELIRVRNSASGLPDGRGLESSAHENWYSLPSG